MNSEQSVYAKSAPLSMPSALDIRCFTIVIEGLTFGLPVECIHTVFEIVAVTPVPLAPPEVLGLVNLRGKIVTAISLRRRLNTNRSMAEPSNLAVGLEYKNESFALVVDEVGDVLTLDEKTEIELPSHLSPESYKIASVHRLDTLILPILDLNWVFAFDPRQAADPQGNGRKAGTAL